MPSPGLSRRALLGLGLSRVSHQLDDAAAQRRDVVAPAPDLPTLTETQARWDAARSADGEAVWACVGAELRALVDELAPGGGADPVVSVFGPQSTLAARAVIDALFHRAAPGAIVALSVWSTGVIAQLLKAAADLDPLPPGIPGVWGWGSRERLRQDLDHHADEIHYRRRELRIRAGSVAAAAERLAAAVPALAAAQERHGDDALARFAPIVEFYAEPGHDEAGGDSTVRVPVRYLLVAARRR